MNYTHTYLWFFARNCANLRERIMRVPIKNKVTVVVKRFFVAPCEYGWDERSGMVNEMTTTTTASEPTTNRIGFGQSVRFMRLRFCCVVLRHAHKTHTFAKTSL